MGRLDGKVALITGAGSGIGRASAILFAREGAKVAVIDRFPETAEKTAADIKNAKGQAIAIGADVSKAADVERMIKKTVDTYGRLDILFNNAGIGSLERGLIVDITEEVWDAVLDTNLKGAFLASRLAIPIMIKQGGGVILNTSSANGIGAVPTMVHYSASKAGMILLCKTIAAEYAKQGIRANAICPGMTVTGMMPPEMFDYLQVDFIPQGRPGKVEELANAALFLVSDDASYVNGTYLLVDGGWSCQTVVPPKPGPGA